VTFADGHTRLCGTSGLWNVNLGYGHPVVADAVADAARHASYLTNFRYTHELLELASAELLSRLSPRFSRVLWLCSGASAVEAAVKLSRQAHALTGDVRRRIVVSFAGSYHGLSMGASAITGEDALQPLYGVGDGECRKVSVDDPSELRALLERQAGRMACVVVEPVLGSGTRPLSAGMIAALAEAQAAGVVVVADEVATGFGRAGPFVAHQAWPFVPDVVLLSKGLTNGAVPGAAVCVGQHLVQRFVDASAVLLHAETAGGHPLTVAAARATLSVFDDPSILAHADRLGMQLSSRLDEVVARAPVAARHCGAGLFRTLLWEYPDGSAPDARVITNAIAHARRLGVVLHPGPGGIQFVPPLVLSEGELDELVAAAEQAMALALESVAEAAPL
jgi:adenosylmethionine-8-amino-7-oxononanoate aminotransferase